MLFRSRNESLSRVELMVMIRPTVLPTPEAAALEAANEKDQSPEIKRAQREEQEYHSKQMEKSRREDEKFEKKMFK
jgi:type II secretory pathway component GspD/PulD (secretin)